MSIGFKYRIKLDHESSYRNIFSLSESHLEIENESNNFILDKISNIRLLKNRNYSINILFLFSSSFIYYLAYISLNLVLLSNVLSIIMVIFSVIISVSIKHFDYVLLINMNHFEFRKIKINKKDVKYAENIVSSITDRFINKKNKYPLSFINYIPFSTNVQSLA